MENKVSIFKRIYWAITDFRIYPFAQREKTSKAVGYFAKFIAIISIILTINFCILFAGIMEEFIYKYNDVIPEFKFEDGILNVETVGEYEEDEFIIVMDTNYNSSELKENLNEKFKGYLVYGFVANDSFKIYKNVGSTETLAANVEFKNFTENFDKASVYKDLVNYNSNAGLKLLMFGAVFVSIFISYFISKLLEVFFVMIVALIFSLIFNIKMKFENYFKMCIYVLTLPTIIQVIAILVVGTISESTAIIYQILLCIYTFYALRALKLDHILVSNEMRDLKRDLEKSNQEENKNEEKEEEKKKDE